MMEIYAAVEKRFIDTLGLNTASFGRSGFERVICAAMKRSGVADATAYLELLSTSPEEFERCLEELVVPETWFFRDTEPFILLKQHLCEKWFPSHPGEKVRILSVPCSTGEEPYSIAMTLMEAGILPQQFHLDAAEISRRALTIADRAVYGKGSFRQPLTAAQEAFFTGPEKKVLSAQHFLSEAVVRTVHFHRDNLVDPRFFAGQAPYQIIFCRNVLIYLTAEARRLVLENVDRLLAPDGILFTGHAELGILLQHGFTAIRHARAFACRKKVLSAQCSVNNSVRSPQSAVRSPLPSALCPQSSALVSPSSALSTQHIVLHAEALALADRGLFDEAAALCRRYLREQRPHADGYCLLGLIHEAARQSGDAEGCYLKALYLDPDHHETLIHLSLLYQQRGNDRKAALYRQRADATEGRANGTVGP
jgi:chemotaxis protein methyltransferase WspC